MDKEKILKEKVYPVKGTTKLALYDPGFDQSGTNLEFFGTISGAPIGLLRIRQKHVTCEPDQYFPKGLEYDAFSVDVFQAQNDATLQVYAGGEYYPKAVKKEYELNCETAQFDCATKFGQETFHTGADGSYASLTHMKQHYGMILNFEFAVDMFSFEELEEKFLYLFPERKMA